MRSLLCHRNKRVLKHGIETEATYIDSYLRFLFIQGKI